MAPQACRRICHRDRGTDRCVLPAQLATRFGIQASIHFCWAHCLKTWKSRFPFRCQSCQPKGIWQDSPGWTSFTEMLSRLNFDFQCPFGPSEKDTPLFVETLYQQAAETRTGTTSTLESKSKHPDGDPCLISWAHPIGLGVIRTGETRGRARGSLQARTRWTLRYGRAIWPNLFSMEVGWISLTNRQNHEKMIG